MESQLLSSKLYANSFDLTNCLYENLWEENTTMLVTTTHAGECDAEIIDIAAKLGRDAVYITTDRRLRNHKDILKSSDSLQVFNPVYSKNDDDKRDFADIVIDGIEEILSNTGVKTFIVDSVTRIAALSFGRNASPTYMMKRLVELQMRRDFSLIVIARDTTKSANRSLSALADVSLSLMPSSATSKQKEAPISQEQEVVAIKDEHISDEEIEIVEEYEVIDNPVALDKSILPLVEEHPNQTPPLSQKGVTYRCKSLSRRDRRLLRRLAQSRKSELSD